MRPLVVPCLLLHPGLCVLWPCARSHALPCPALPCPALVSPALHSVKYDAETGEAVEGSPYDADSASTIRLSNGMVLYLREVDE
jgi:hypothetical protein